MINSVYFIDANDFKKFNIENFNCKISSFLLVKDKIHFHLIFANYNEYLQFKNYIDKKSIKFF